ncbi:MAG: MarR family transcriptional regulator [Burkholderiaceae bacterium]
MEQESPDRNFGLIVHDVARLLRTNFDRRVRELGLTRSQWWVLTHLYHRDGLSQTELAELMEIEKPSLGRLLDRLEAKNWIKRGGDPNDRRVNRVYLTLDVKPMVRQMRGHASAVRRQALAGLGEQQCEQLIDTLSRIKENLLEPDTAMVGDPSSAPKRARR